MATGENDGRVNPMHSRSALSIRVNGIFHYSQMRRNWPRSHPTSSTLAPLLAPNFD